MGIYCSPISIALYIKKNDWEKYMTIKSEMGLEERVSIALYLQTNSSLYPINALRNLAIQNVHTSHFFMSDMDMWPSFSLHDVLQGLPSYILNDDMFAGIIPAFEIEKPSCSSLADCVSKFVFSKKNAQFQIRSPVSALQTRAHSMPEEPELLPLPRKEINARRSAPCL